MCDNCYNGCSGAPISDNCVKYTGQDVSQLNICQYDTLLSVETKILNAIVQLMSQQSIDVSTLTLCSYVSNYITIGQPLSLNILLQALINGQCDLANSMGNINLSGIVINGACLSLPSNPKIGDYIQAIANQLCSLTNTVSGIASDYVKASQLPQLVQQYVQGNQNSVSQFNTRMVPYVAYEYYGSLSNFDSTGRGLGSVGFDKVYLCNGLNGTPDRRGRVGVGAVANVPGAQYDQSVDPTIQGNPNIHLSDKIGSNNVVLDITQIPSHNHQVVDNGHTHQINRAGYGGIGGQGPKFVGGALTPDGGYGSTELAQANISLNNTGGGLGHNNIQPSIGAYYIMYLP